MRLKPKIFLLVGGLFLSTMLIVLITRSIELSRTLTDASKELQLGIQKYDEERKEDIYTFLSTNVKDLGDRMGILLEKISGFEWIKIHFAPNPFNASTNDWSSSAGLFQSNQWLDFVQTTSEDKLTSLIVTRPPSLRSFVRVPLGDHLWIILPQVQGDFPEAYVAVPFWVNSPHLPDSSSYSSSIFTLETRQHYYLLFTIDQLLSMSISEFTVPDFSDARQFPTKDFDNATAEIYHALAKNTLTEIKGVQDRLKHKSNIIALLKSPEKLEPWINERLKHVKFSSSSNPNQSMFVSSWENRFVQNNMIWQLGTLIGTGVWGFDPAAPYSPKGIACFDKEEPPDLDLLIPYAGDGLLTKDSFHDIGLPVNLDSTSSIDGKDSIINKKLAFLTDSEPHEGVFITNTLTLINPTPNAKPSYSTVTVGVSLNRVLQIFALASSNNILFLRQEANPVVFTPLGTQIDSSNWLNLDFEKMKELKEGTIEDINGTEFIFIHIASITEDDGHIFSIELKQNFLGVIRLISEQASALSNRLTIDHLIISGVFLLIALLVLSHILNKMIGPLNKLAVATKVVGSGNLRDVMIPKDEMHRKDEIGLLCNAFDQMVGEMKEGEEVRSLLNKVVSKDVADKILREGIKLGGEIRDVSVLFADIRGFTHITEHMPPEEVLNMLNDCLGLMSKIIDDHKGIIDKYIGDEIMALFGAPITTIDAPLLAIRAAIEMKKVLKVWNAGRKDRHLVPLPMGIGIHTGPVIAGNIGAENHLNYTILGHNVNLASRVCDHAGEMQILITEETFNAPNIKTNIRCNPLSPIFLPGISKPIQLYEVLD